MGVPQSALFVEETSEHLHVEWLFPDDAPTPVVLDAVAAARRLSASLRGPNQVWGFAPSLWQRLAPGNLPADVRDFAGVSGPAGVAPATQRSVWMWAAGNTWEKVWSCARAADAALAALAVDRFELRCYSAVDNRDPIGFIDGTENPGLDEAIGVALYPCGGSAVLMQKWVHDLAAFDALPVVEQEAVFGRTKADSTQLSDDRMPATSHVSRNTIADAQGNELHIFRRNTPYATLAETGTMYIACTNDPARTNTMLERMFGVTGDALHDRLTEFSTAVSGSYYWVPSMADLTALLGSLDSQDVLEPSVQSGRKTDLGVGSLLHLAD